MTQSPIIAFIREQTQVGPASIEAVLKLLYEEECTVPFITRYRKERTGGLDEVQILAIQENFEHYQEREKRRAYILESLQSQNLLTDQLREQIVKATKLSDLEDIYAPYKSKRKTKAMKAREAGLEPLAQLLETSGLSLAQLKEKHGTQFINAEHEVPDFEAAMEGAKNIIMENIVHHVEAKEELRRIYWSQAKLVSTKKKDIEENKDTLKFKDYFDFSQSIKELASPKAAHRYLAMRRGQELKLLKLNVEVEEGSATGTLKRYFPFNESHPEIRALLHNALEKTYASAIHPSLDLEVKTELKQHSDEAAIGIFRTNLRELLLGQYLGPKAVLGVDPGVRTGCKLAVVDHTGKFCAEAVVYPHPPQEQVEFSMRVIEALVQKYNIQHIAIGNGTYGRETYQMLKAKLACADKVEIVMTSEAGASVYSTSEIARKEFPDQDPTVRGAISIARRFQDPLAELVKIDPKSIGVGQYQHDVNQAKLKKSLGQVVESCVNYVGVDLNTASAPLLSYISGVGPGVAQNIVSFREKQGSFKKREDLLKVGRFTDKIYQQAAGFMRIYKGENPLDATFIHPERYNILEKWCGQQGHTLQQLTSDQTIMHKLKTDTKLQAELGDFTFKDILQCLQAPSQDPRTVFENTAFRDDAKSLSDIKVGEWYPGVINNITQFGAFVDIGIKQSGLLHISQMADKFVEDPTSLFKVGQEVKVKVLEVDIARDRLSLSMKSDARATQPGARTQNTGSSNDRPRSGGGYRPSAATQPTPELKNKAFAGLKNLKL